MMSHTVKISMISDSIININNNEFYVHDIRTIVVNSNGKITEIYLEPRVCSLTEAEIWFLESRIGNQLICVNPNDPEDQEEITCYPEAVEFFENCINEERRME